MSDNARKNNNQEKHEPAEGQVDATGHLSELDAQHILAEEAQEIDYQAVIDELNDKMLRALAEAQNMRRRADIDIQNAKNFSTQSFAKDLLGVMDNLFSACQAISDEDAASNAKLKSIKDGVEITKKEMLNVFERNGIKRVEPLGLVFDPNSHQAISQIEDASAIPGTVLQVLQAGYTLKERLLRPALVVVAKAADA